jgi:hypothetical protein
MIAMAEMRAAAALICLRGMYLKAEEADHRPGTA